MSEHWKPVYHPPRRVKPPQYRRIPTYRRPQRTIGEERGGILDCWEFTYYYVYLSEEVPSSDRLFELRIRIPLKPWQSPKMTERVIAAKADEKMVKKGIDTRNFDKKCVGIRKVGTTKSKSGRYILVNKATKETWPDGGWGYLD